MRKVTLDEIREMARRAKGSVRKIYLHWTAGNYSQFFEDYHINVDYDGSIYVSTDDLTGVKAHTWRRNTGAIGIAMCCCLDAVAYADGRVDFGSVPPTAPMVDSTAKVVAVLCEELGLSVDYYSVMTHAEAADIDGYGPSSTFERWDLLLLPDFPSDELKNGGDVIRGKAIWFQNHKEQL